MHDFGKFLRGSTLFNRAAYAGPRRLLIIGGAGLAVVGIVLAVSLTGSDPLPKSTVAKMPSVDALPGGLNSNPVQNKLALETDQEQATQATKTGTSYTPPLAAGQPVKPASPFVPVTQTVSPAPSLQNWPIDGAPPPPRPVDPQVHFVSDQQTVTRDQTVKIDPAQEQVYTDAINRLLANSASRPPQTVVVQTPDTTGSGNSGVALATGNTDAPKIDASYPSPLGSSDASGRDSRLLVPAGRGIYAHTIVAVDSDSGGPIILQADSGPLAGDRMIGSFSRAGGQVSSDRLVVQVTSVEYHGHMLSADGLVIAPDSMETTVASSVDEHYVSRFILPAAAAFVQGLGQAIATTSNTVGNISPLGGTTYTTQLDLNQQLGVAAGVAAGSVADALRQEAPRGPTVHLAANVDVGVMFLAPLRDTPSQ